MTFKVSILQQGSAATRFWCDVILNNSILTNFSKTLLVKIR